jgi:hypothetical protein
MGPSFVELSAFQTYSKVFLEQRDRLFEICNMIMAKTQRSYLPDLEL